MKDRITVLAFANASGDCTIKSMVIYQSEHQGILKRNKVIKSKLPVMWQSSPKSLCTRQSFMEWVHETFCPQVKKYLREKQLPIKCLLVMDNSTAHPQNLADDIPDGSDFIKLNFTPPNTTPPLKPMDQQVISSFKKLYPRGLFRKCFEVMNNTQLRLRKYRKYNFTILNCLNLVDNEWIQVAYIALKSAFEIFCQTL